MGLVTIANRKFAPLTDGELGVLHAALTGELFWCSGVKHYWAPVNDPEQGADWARARTVRAGLIHWLLRDPEAVEHVNRNGIRIAGARIEGDFDLSHLVLRWPLGFPRCFIPKDLTLFFTRAMNLDFAGSWTRSIDARRLVAEGSLLLGVGSHVDGELDLDDAQINGDLDCSGGHFMNPTGAAIKAEGLRVDGCVMLGSRSRPRNGVDVFRSFGEVNLTGAQIGGDLDCEGGRFCAAKGGKALVAKAVRVSGSVLLRAHKRLGGEVDLFSARGEVTLEDAQIGAALDCSGGRFVNRYATALSLNGGKVEGNVFLNMGFRSLGEVNLVGARIGSFLECSGGRFINLNSMDRKPAQFTGSALIASCATIGGSVHMMADEEQRVFQARGSVGLGGAQIGGSLTCLGGRFLDGVRALTLTGATVRGDVSLGRDQAYRPFIARGTVELIGTEIKGQLNCTGGCFIRPENPTDERSATIAAALAKIGGHVLFGEGFVTDGVVSFDFAEIGGLLSFEQAGFTEYAENGLHAQAASVKGDFVWRPGPSVAEACSPPLFRSPLKWILEAARRFSPRLPHDHHAQYKLDLSNTSVGRLKDHAAKWPSTGNLTIAGFVYGAFHSDSEIDANERLRWLKRQAGEYHPQPYRQLAKVLQQAGREEDAIKVLIANEKALRASGNLNFLSWLWKWILQLTIGYGYRPLRALVFVAFFVFLGTFLFDWGYQARVITPTDQKSFDEFRRNGKPPPYYSDFSPLVYSLETFLPLVDLYQGKQWRPNPEVQPEHSVEPIAILHALPILDRLPEPRPIQFSPQFGTILRYYLWLHIMMGWFFATMFAAGLAGLVRGRE